MYNHNKQKLSATLSHSGTAYKTPVLFQLVVAGQPGVNLSSAKEECMHIVIFSRM